MKKVAGAARRAIIDYNMIQKGDYIAVTYPAERTA